MVPNPGQQQYELSARLDGWNEALARAQHNAEVKDLAQDSANSAPAAEVRSARRPFWRVLAFRLRRRSSTA